MSRFLRITLTWLLALALPLQGYAAQASLMLGMAHQASVQVHQHERHANADNAGATAQHDAGCCNEDDAKSAADGGTTHGKCNVCTAGCGAVAITSPTVSIQVPSHGMTMVASVAMAHERYFTGGIDRPPRPSLA